MIYHTRGEHANHYTTDAVTNIIVTTSKVNYCLYDFLNPRMKTDRKTDMYIGQQNVNNSEISYQMNLKFTVRLLSTYLVNIKINCSHMFIYFDKTFT